MDVLIRAFAETVGRRDDWSLVIAGDGPLRERLRALGYIEPDTAELAPDAR